MLFVDCNESDTIRSIFTQNQKAMIRTGILGDEQVCKSIASNIRDVGEIKLVGFFDPAGNRSVSSSGSPVSFFDSETLIRDVDAVIALSPMSSPEHIENLVRNSKHVLFEPTHFFSRTEASRLMNMIDEADLKVQPSFDNRYNLVFRAVRPFVKNPRLIVSNHVTPFDAKKQISVLHDILLHDIDLVLSLVQSEIKSVTATSVSIDRTSPDIINTRIEFNNKCVAQFHAGRIGTDASNEMSFYQNNHYIYADLLNHQAFVARKKSELSDVGLFSSQKGDIVCDPIPIWGGSRQFSSIKAFADSIVKNTVPEVDVETMMRTFSVTQVIAEKLKLVSH